jgi:hypothetical protein
VQQQQQPEVLQEVVETEHERQQRRHRQQQKQQQQKQEVLQQTYAARGLSPGRPVGTGTVAALREGAAAQSRVLVSAHISQAEEALRVRRHMSAQTCNSRSNTFGCTAILPTRAAAMMFAPTAAALRHQHQLMLAHYRPLDCGGTILTLCCMKLLYLAGCIPWQGISAGPASPHSRQHAGKAPV